ncbi:MAG: hypothetical protein HC866_24530 [Leptolyngbyaceae cyanobacterium RU_5_1]|nr:hypothetical protein [Leptolyngbyaceae cyanobacterium RU_5_1]
MSEEIGIANTQLIGTSGVERSRLERQIENLVVEMESTETQLNTLEASNPTPNRHYLQLKEDLPKIDFVKQMNRVESILKRFNPDGGAALFLIQDSYSMAGAYLKARIQDCLGTKAKHYPVVFSLDTGVDERALLDRLAGYFDVQAISELNQYALAIVNKLCQSLRGGTTIFVELQKWDEVPDQDRVLSWFLEHFWIPLGQQLNAVSQTYRGFKVIAVIVSDTELSAECLELPCYCKSREFDSQKVVPLPLKNWEEGEIQHWLEIHQELSRSRSETLAKRIYQKSKNGIPQLVIGALIQEFT